MHRAHLHISTIPPIGKTNSLPNILYPISVAIISLSSSSGRAILADSSDCRWLTLPLTTDAFACQECPDQYMQSPYYCTAESKHHSTSGHWLSAMAHHSLMLVTSGSFYNSFSVQNSTRPISLQCSTSLASVRRTALHNKHPPLAPPKSCVTKIHIYFLKCHSESTFSIHPMYLWSPGKVVSVSGSPYTTTTLMFAMSTPYENKNYFNSILYVYTCYINSPIQKEWLWQNNIISSLGCKSVCRFHCSERQHHFDYMPTKSAFSIMLQKLKNLCHHLFLHNRFGKNGWIIAVL